jgi:hypothetical protein
MNGRQVHRTGTWVLSLAMVAIGIALVAEAIGGAGGVISIRLLLGLMFCAGGGARVYLEIRRDKRA